MSEAPLSPVVQPAGIELDRRQVSVASSIKPCACGCSTGDWPAARVAGQSGIWRQRWQFLATAWFAPTIQLYAKASSRGVSVTGLTSRNCLKRALAHEKLSTKVSTGFSTGLPTALSTNWLDLPVVPSVKLSTAERWGALKKNHLATPPEWSAPGFSGGCSGVRSFSFRGVGQVERGFLAKTGFAATVLWRSGGGCALARNDCCLFAQFQRHAVHG